MDQDHYRQRDLDAIDLLDLLLVLILATLGGKAALHLLFRHRLFISSHCLSSPSFFSSVRAARAAYLSLVLSGETVLALHLITILTRRSFPTLEFFLLKVMGLVCPLLFVTASIAYFGDRYRQRQNPEQRRYCHDASSSSGENIFLDSGGLLHVPSGESPLQRPTNAPAKQSQSQVPGSSSERENRAVSGVWTQHLSTCSFGKNEPSPSRESAFRTPQHELRAETHRTQEMSTSGSPKPQFCRVSRAVSEHTTPRQTQFQMTSPTCCSGMAPEGPQGGVESHVRFHETKQAGEAECDRKKRTTTAILSPPLPKAVEGESLAKYIEWFTLGYLWSVAVGVSLVTLLEPGMYPCFLNACGERLNLVQQWAHPQGATEELVFHFDMCACDAASLLFLYCAFYVPLLVYLAYNLVQCLPPTLWSRGLSLLTDEDGNNDDEVDFSDDGSSNAEELAATGMAMRNFQDKGSHGSGTQNTAAAAIATLQDGEKTLALPGGITPVLETAGSSNMLPMTTQRSSAQFPNISHSQTDPQAEQAGLMTMPAVFGQSSSCRPPHRSASKGDDGDASDDGGCVFRSLCLSSPQTSALKDEAGDGGCVVCRQMAPYVVLTTLVLLVQFVLVLPAWLALRWEQTGRLKIPSPLTVFPPAYCAVSYVFWKTLSLNNVQIY